MHFPHASCTLCLNNMLDNSKRNCNNLFIIYISQESSQRPGEYPGIPHPRPPVRSDWTNVLRGCAPLPHLCRLPHSTHTCLPDGATAAVARHLFHRWACRLPVHGRSDHDQGLPFRLCLSLLTVGFEVDASVKMVNSHTV